MRILKGLGLGLVAIVAMTTTVFFTLDLALSAPVVQMNSVTKEVVAVITKDGVVHPPEYLKECKGGYDVEWVAPRQSN